MARPRRHARPTRSLFDAPLATTRVARQHSWVRLHRAGYSPLYSGSSGENRFDTPGSGTLYLARKIEGSFVEVFCRTPHRGTSRITEAHLEQYRVAEFRSSRGLKLVDLAGKGLVKMGLDARLATGSYKLAQEWAGAFQEHPDQPDGILYRSRHDPKQRLAAIFERAQPVFELNQCGTLRDYLGDDFYVLLDRYQVALL